MPKGFAEYRGHAGGRLHNTVMLLSDKVLFKKYIHVYQKVSSV